MKINFKKLILHNFMSYGHSEIDLLNRSYCLVKGVNNCSTDNAISNGSGKSSWVSAICYALTGETSQGVAKNIKNIYVKDNSCYVTLYLSCDSNEYVITRYNKPKSDLTIIINGKDKSGKGVRESELVLSKYLPDLDSDLISSVIILGQGLPNRLTSLSPSGMKQKLEKLSKSDFMIEDIKDRIEYRTNDINKKIRDLSDKLLVLSTNKETYEKYLSQLNNDLSSYNNVNYDKDIDEATKMVTANKINCGRSSYLLDALNKDYDKYNNQLVDSSKEQSNELNEELEEFNNISSELNNKIEYNKLVISSIKLEIEKYNCSDGLCPVCRQLLPESIRLSTKSKQEELDSLIKSSNELTDKLNNIKSSHRKNQDDINNKYNQHNSEIRKEISKCKEEISKYQLVVNNDIREENKWNSKLETLQQMKKNYEESIKTLNNKISNCQYEIKSIESNIDKYSKELDECNKHLVVVKKIDTLVKRDFRGYLLSDIISYIDSKCKEYANIIFGNSNLNFELDGNNINITYCKKQYECLSGGEKQKVDLIIQFSIRDMLSKFLGFSSNILVLDEIFDNLDSLGVTSMTNLINDKLNDIESIFIISHHPDELNIMYDNEMTIIKNERGISEVS